MGQSMRDLMCTMYRVPVRDALAQTGFKLPEEFGLECGGFDNVVLTFDKPYTGSVV